MGGFFGITSRQDCMMDVFFGVDYHSHLGTRRGGMAAYDKEIGLQRKIHNIENSPFRTKFEHIFNEMFGTSAIGCISDSDPQPMLIRSRIGTYALCTVGIINQSHDILFQRPLGYSACIFIKINRSRPIRQKRQIAGTSGFLKRIRIAHILCSTLVQFLRNGLQNITGHPILPDTQYAAVRILQQHT